VPGELDRRALLLRLSVILFCAELAHGMLLYGIIPELVTLRFPPEIPLAFGPFSTLTPQQLAGFGLATYTLAELLSKVAAGHWVDRRGPDLPVRLGLLVSLVTVPMIVLAQRADLLLLGAFLHGLGAAPLWPAVISSWTRGRGARERGAIMGQILTGWMAGLGLGVILGHVLVALPGLLDGIAFYTPILMWGLTLAAAFWGFRGLGVPAAGGERGQGLPPIGPELRVMAVGLFVQNLAFGSLILAFRYFATDYLELSTAQLGLMILLGGGPAVLLLGPMGRVADRIGRRKAVIGSMLVVSPLIMAAPLLIHLPLGPWGRFAIMIPGLLIAGASYAFLLPAWHALALGRIPEQRRGRSLALLMSVEMVALAVGHILGPSIYTRVSFMAPFLFAGATFVILAVIYVFGYILPQDTPDEPHPVRLDDLDDDGGDRRAPVPGEAEPAA
jgi:MFS transporter, DHA1 family, multidrug resistance protein